MPSDGFEAALLSPHAPVPASIKGRPERRFAVYRNNVVVGLVRAMESNFPAVRRLLGDVYYAGLAREFVLAHPPKSPLMFTYGTAFPDYLGQQHDLVQYPYLSDVARLEILMRESHHAIDAAPLPADALATLSPEQLEKVRFVPHPATRFLRSDFAVGSITSANRDGHSVRIDVVNPETVFVMRPDVDVSLSAFTPKSGTFLIALLTGEELGRAADAAFAIDPDFDMSSALGTALAHGLFTALKLENDT
jgi:Putative DNA-binding domain